MSQDLAPIRIAWFDRALERGVPAYGIPETLSWNDFTTVFRHRRIGEKDGTCFTPARFVPEPGRGFVRRKKANVIARAAVVLDIELNKKTGEIPPSPMTAMRRVKSQGWSCIIYSSHSHSPPHNPRYRLIFPVSQEIPPEIPAPEIVAEQLQLEGVIDRSKIGASSVFYTPSQSGVHCDQPHFAQRLNGKPVEASWLMLEGQRRLAAAEAKAQAETATRLAARAERGLSGEESLIERINQKLDLEQLLLSHGYTKAGDRFLCPDSSSGMPAGKIFGTGRYFTHSTSDLLYVEDHAIDAFDAATILDFDGDRSRALRELAERYGLTKIAENKALAALMFRMIRQHACQARIESAAMSEGRRLGLSREDVFHIAAWVRQKSLETPRAA